MGRVLAVVAVMALVGCATVSRPAYEAARLKRLAAPTLEKFESEAAFVAYIRRVRDLARSRGVWWASARRDGKQLARSQRLPDVRGLTNRRESLMHARYAKAPASGAPAQVPCPDGVKPPCYSDAQEERVVVTGSRISTPAASITNTQMRGVDEGDIVKQFGAFLVVLQDGRLFTVNTRPNGRAGLAVVGRANVYRSAKEDTWYDEMLIHGSRIVIVGYSYDRQAAEFSTFNIDEKGRLSREATYYITANDYYSGGNYATRLVDDKLIIRTQLDVREIDPDKPINWPRLRRWQREAEGDAALSAGKQIYGARDIYRPVQATAEPTLATISICPLGKARAGDELECRTTAFVSSSWWVYFVSREHAYLWAMPGDDDRNYPQRGPQCAPPAASAVENGVPGAVFRLTLDTGGMAFMPVLGDPIDQFSLDVDDRELRALVAWNGSCDDVPLEVKYVRASLTAFTSRAAGPAYTDLPSPHVPTLENRFIEGALVYGGRRGWGSWPPFEDERHEDARVVSVPTATPEKPTVLTVPHNVIRIESIGKAAVLTGYKDDRGLSISLLDGRATPDIASTVVLADRFESEGRSHAYNAAIEADGSGIMGVPTVRRTRDATRWAWRSRPSDVSYLHLESIGHLKPLGELSPREKSEHPAYKCEVSCIDWYGNTRPIFVDGRIFALAATEVVEGRVLNGAIIELNRVNLTAPLLAKR